VEILIWLIIAIAGAIGAAVIANAKGRSGVGYFLLGLLFWPLAILVAIGMPARPLTPSGPPRPNDLVRCPYCPGFMRADARHCPNCGRAPLRPEPLKRCPACAEYVQAAAVKCRFCGTDLPDPRSPEGIAAARERLIKSGVRFTPQGAGWRIETERGAFIAHDQRAHDDLVLKLNETLQSGGRP
jgi:hypothetical protein